MIVCICHAISDKQIRASVRAGVRTLEGIERACGGAGTQCGTCRQHLVQILREPTAEGSPNRGGQS